MIGLDSVSQKKVRCDCRVGATTIYRSETHHSNNRLVGYVPIPSGLHPPYDISITALIRLYRWSRRAFDYSNAVWKSVAEFFDVGDDQDFIEIVLDGVDRLFDFLNAGRILRAESLVNN